MSGLDQGNFNNPFKKIFIGKMIPREFFVEILRFFL